MPKENKIIDFIQEYEQSNEENCISIYFSRRTTKKYITVKPTVTSEVQKEIYDTVNSHLKKELNDCKIVDYNAIGVIDGELEVIPADNLIFFNDFISSITNENLYTDMTAAMPVEKIGFYCVDVFFKEKHLYLFRQFQKLKKLRKGLFTQIINNELSVAEGNFLGIDEFIDLAVFDDQVYALNHISLERIFNYKDVFIENTQSALNDISKKNVINNFDDFKKDCMNDVRIAKKFTHIMSSGKLPLFFENYEKVPEVVKELNLDVDFDNDNKLVYRDKTQLFHIVALMSDSYFKSLIANRTGIAKLEGVV